MRDKFFIEYPLAKSYDEALKWIQAGNELWQEDSEDCPDCVDFDSIDCFNNSFPDKEIDSSDGVHLVPANPESSRKPKVGDVLVCVETQGYCCGQDEDDRIKKGEQVTVEDIREKDYLFFDEHANRYGPWNYEYFAQTNNMA